MTKIGLAKTIKKITKELILEKLELAAQIKVEKDEDNFRIIVDVQDPGLLIGYHGETLNAVQHLLKVLVFAKTNQWPSLVVDVADYRQNREKVLQSMAISAAQRVRHSQKALALSPLSSYERRVIHLIISGEEGVVSESEGEGNERRVVIRPKKEKNIGRSVNQ